MEVVLLIGLQASGKSTFCAQRFGGTHELVSKDLFPNANRPQHRQMRLVRAALEAGRSVVVDNTNPTRKDRAALIAEARARGASVLGYYFESRVEDSLRRNQERQGRKRVPDVAVYSTIKILERPTGAEGFDRLFYVRLVAEGGFEVTDWIEEGS